MTLFETCLDIVEKILRQQTISSTSLPIILTLRDSVDNNITNSLFGMTSLPLGADYWQVNDATVQNQLDINFGTAISDYILPLYAKLTTSDSIVLAPNILLDTSIELGNELILYSDTGVTLTLDFGTVKLSNAILNLLFKGNNTFPSSLSAKYYDNSNTLQATITLTAAKWSKREIGTLGEIFFEYGNTTSLPTINALINLVKITDTSNNVWFECPITLPVSLKPNAIIYSNSLVLRINNPEINLTTYTAPSNSSSLFYVDFNGEFAEKSNNSHINSAVGIGYDSELKLFGTECLVCGSTTNVQYEDVIFPNEFTLNAFVYFTTPTAGRLITLAEKNGVFSLKKTAVNNLEVSINGSVVISTSWVPVSGVWNHIWVQKSSSEIRLRVNSGDINTNISYTTTTATNSNPFTIASNILGLCNGVYLEDGTSTFQPFVQPLPKRRYDFSNISFYEWLNLSFVQLKRYF